MSDDEPDNGPEHYILVVGFPHPNLFSSLTNIGIDVDCILKVESEDYPASESTMPADDDNVEKDEKQLGTCKDLALSSNIMLTIPKLH